MMSTPKHLHRRCRYRRGFTLIEILVVVIIIAVVMAIALPMLSSARKAARKTQATSNLVAIESALQAYKTDFADYPRPDQKYTGFAVLGKAMFCPGPSAGFPAVTLTSPSWAGTIQSSGSDPTSSEYREYVAFGMPNAAGGFSTTTTPPDPTNWAEFWVRDGKDGPGFRVGRFGGGQTYGPYLQEGKFRLRGLAILDSWDNPILYFAARPQKPVPAPPGGPNAGEWPLLPLTDTKAQMDAAHYNSFHNLSFFMRPGDDIANTQHQQAARKRIEAVLVVPGDNNANDFDGVMETQSPKNERAVTDKAILLWSAGADGNFGPNFAGADPTPEEIRKVDDVTNFKAE
jgi:prepilin-type N-terminal cleavage/methylation domain-containing protein